MSKLYVLNGVEMGKSFQLKEGVNTVGRGLENDITLVDETVSRRHFKILKKADRYLLIDLGSKNGTFVGGKYLRPGAQIGVKKGEPIAVGMTVVGIGKASTTLTKPFLDSVGLTEQAGEESGIFLIHKEKTNQKKLEALYRVSDLYDQMLPLKETLEKVLDVITELLVEIDTASIMLIDPSTTKVVFFSHRSRNPEGRSSLKVCPQVLYHVMKEKAAVMISDSDRAESNRALASTLKTHGISSVMCVPMISDSQVVGVIYLHSLKRLYGFTPEDVCLFEEIAGRTNNFVQYGQHLSEFKIMHEPGS